MDYDDVLPDQALNNKLQIINCPKFILSNATYNHANQILNNMGIDEQFIKIYSRDNIPRMKPFLQCYLSVQQDIIRTIQTNKNQYIFFDDLLINLENAHKMGWITIWISPYYYKSNKFSFITKSYPTLHSALDDLDLKLIT